MWHCEHHFFSLALLLPLQHNQVWLVSGEQLESVTHRIPSKFCFVCVIMKNALEGKHNLVLGYLFQETSHHTGHLLPPHDPPQSASVCNPHWFAWMLVLPQLDILTYTSQGAAWWNWWRHLENLGWIWSVGHRFCSDTEKKMRGVLLMHLRNFYFVLIQRLITENIKGMVNGINVESLVLRNKCSLPQLCLNPIFSRKNIMLYPFICIF